jgi:Ulp1 protease family, C-terminal catalytic domain
VASTDQKRTFWEAIEMVESLKPRQWVKGSVVDKLFQSFTWAPGIQYWAADIGMSWRSVPKYVMQTLRKGLELVITDDSSRQHWTVLWVQINQRRIYHFDSRSSHGKHNTNDKHQSCPTCKVLSRKVDEVRIRAGIQPETAEWTFRVNDHQNPSAPEIPLSPQQKADDVHQCGIYAILNGYCLASGLNPREQPFNPDDLRLQVAQKILEGNNGFFPKKEAARAASILEAYENARTGVSAEGMQLLNLPPDRWLIML